MIDALKTWWSRFVASIIAQCPDDLDACESCREIHCDERMAVECKLREIQGLRVGKRLGRPTKPARD